MIGYIDFREELLATLPKRVIEGRDGPYLSRYTLRDYPNGGHLYVHHFHRSDEDRELHSHPWPGKSLILSGGYVEERRTPTGIVTKTFNPGMVNVLEPDTFHRVDLLKPEVGCWTVFMTGGKEQSWGFWNRDTDVFTPWRVFIQAKL